MTHDVQRFTESSVYNRISIFGVGGCLQKCAITKVDFFRSMSMESGLSKRLLVKHRSYYWSGRECFIQEHPCEVQYKVRSVAQLTLTLAVQIGRFVRRGMRATLNKLRA